MDMFVEQIIVRKKTAKQTMMAVFIMALASLLIVMSVFLLRMFGFLVAAALGYGMWWLLSEMNIEYEYCITNGDIDIDKIIARRKRERVVSVAIQKLETAGRYEPEKWRERGVDRVVLAAPSEKEEGLYCFSYRTKKRGHTLVIFQPNERMLEAFEKSLPRLIQKDFQK